jgi:MerR family mercuric resistance operon transcriptional regulator
MPIGMLAARSACPIDTIRFYEKIGILPRPARTEGGHRLYSLAAAQRLIFVRRTRALGFTLDDVRALLRLADREQSACAEAKSMAQTHLIDIRAKIDDLTAMAATLIALIASCDNNGGTECPLIQVLSGDRG